MLCYSNGFKPYIFLVKTCPCATHIYILLVLRQNLLNIIFWAVSEDSRTVEAVLTGHVRPMARTYPASQTCSAPGPDMSKSRVSSLYKGSESPLRTLVFFLFHSISCGGQGLSRRFWVFSTESLQFLGDLTPLPLRIFKP
jgi:hypothetical protein